MIKDLQAEETDNEEMIEVLLEGTSVWIPVMLMKLYSVDNQGDIHKIQQVRVRKLFDEKDEGTPATVSKTI